MRRNAHESLLDQRSALSCPGVSRLKLGERHTVIVTANGAKKGENQRWKRKYGADCRIISLLAYL